MRTERKDEEGGTIPGAANGTINRELETLSKMLRLAYKNGKLTRLPFVEKLNTRLPKKWDRKLNRFVPDDDWLLWDFHSQKIRGKHVENVRR